MKTVIIKYSAGNIRSVIFALERLGVQATVTDNKEELLAADKVIFPGVGEASSAMAYLRQHKLDELIVSLKQPVLGICLGMQLLCDFSEEGNTACLGIFKKRVKRFHPIEGKENPEQKIPQIGWNNVYELKSELFKDIPESTFMYFVHGYYVEKGEDTIAVTNYIQEYSSALRKNNFFAAQFHPEKSGTAGQKLLENFLKM
ncbi:MAG: imidazole glycerol phosphate synthase subunit HisH [Bacteroidia bacterium]|nr:imidazole glycerol phosphate synthase subunit HisH [Bacteroidia bacterium]